MQTMFVPEVSRHKYVLCSERLGSVSQGSVLSRLKLIDWATSPFSHILSNIVNIFPFPYKEMERVQTQTHE